MSNTAERQNEEPLSYSTLIALLQSDPRIQTLIRQLADVAPVGTPATLEPLREELAPQLELLRLLHEDQTLAPNWVDTSASQGHQLLQLVAIAAQWERILELWERFAERCRQYRQAADNSTLQLLNGCVAIHNLIWDTRQARLIPVELDSPFDYRLHQRATSTGESVTALWLPGLANAGGQIQKLPLVAT